MDKSQLDGFQLYIQLKNKKQISTDRLFILLEKIDREGSISKAASDMKISYRHAWGTIKETEELLGMKLLDKKIGGAEGGGATLTREGREMLGHYQSIRDSVDSQLNALISNKGEARPGREKSRQGNFFSYLLMASTMEPIDTGLLDLLEKEYFNKTGTLVRHIALGSGKALQIAKSGSVDLVLAHSPKEEEDFMSQGFGGLRREIMGNRYYLVGPESDPAGIGNMNQAVEIEDLFRQIALTCSVFISRGDNSGTHEREMEIWDKAKIPPEERNTIVGGSIAGNLECLDIAFEKLAYTLVDSTSYLLYGKKRGMRVFAGRNKGIYKDLDNIFSLLAVRRFPSDNARFEEAVRFIDWLSGKEGRQIIDNYPKGEGQEPYYHSMK